MNMLTNREKELLNKLRKCSELITKNEIFLNRVQSIHRQVIELLNDRLTLMFDILSHKTFIEHMKHVLHEIAIKEVFPKEYSDLKYIYLMFKIVRDLGKYIFTLMELEKLYFSIGIIPLIPIEEKGVIRGISNVVITTDGRIVFVIFLPIIDYVNDVYVFEPTLIHEYLHMSMFLNKHALFCILAEEHVDKVHEYIRVYSGLQIKHFEDVDFPSPESDLLKILNYFSKEELKELITSHEDFFTLTKGELFIETYNTLVDYNLIMQYRLTFPDDVKKVIRNSVHNLEEILKILEQHDEVKNFIQNIENLCIDYDTYCRIYEDYRIMILSYINEVTQLFE